MGERGQGPPFQKAAVHPGNLSRLQKKRRPEQLSKPDNDPPRLEEYQRTIGNIRTSRGKSIRRRERSRVQLGVRLAQFVVWPMKHFDPKIFTE